MRKIKVAIAEDQFLFRKGVISLLKETDNIQVIIEVDNGKLLLEELEKCGKKLPDIIFMDIRMPELDGVKTTERVVKLYPNVKIIVLTMFNSDDHILQMHRIGAHGFLTKDSVLEDLLDAVDMVINKGMYYSNHTSKVLLENAEKIFKSTVRSGAYHQLSPRELDVIRMICMEKSMYEVAEELRLSVRTIEWHKKNIFEKLNVKSTLGLMRYALEHGLL